LRSIANVPSWKRKAARKAAAADTRILLRLAAEYDPVRTAGIGLARTLAALGWSVRAGEVISDGLAVQFAQADKFVAFEVVPSTSCVPPDHADASTTPASPLVTGMEGTAKRVVPPVWTPFPAAPAPWDNPALGLVLDKVTAARHATIRGKGWKLVAVPQSLWEVATKAGPYARRDLLLSLTLPLAPFDPRPVATGLVGGSTAGVAAGGAGAAAGGRLEGSATVSTSTSNRSKRAAERRASGSSGAPAPSASATADKLSGAAKRSLSSRRRGGRGAATGSSSSVEAESGGWEVVQEAEEAAADATDLQVGKKVEASAAPPQAKAKAKPQVKATASGKKEKK